MNAIDLCHFANNSKTHGKSEYRKSEIRCRMSRNTQGELYLSQKCFLTCESCFWCVSSLYCEDKDKIKMPPFLHVQIVLTIKLNCCIFYNSYSMNDVRFGLYYYLSSLTLLIRRFYSRNPIS